MNYQLLVESYSFGTTLSRQEIKLLNLELEAQIINLSYSKDSGCLKPAPNYITKKLNLKINSLWITCLAETIDRNQYPELGKTKGAQVHDELIKNGLAVG